MNNIIRAVFCTNEYETTAQRPDKKPFWQWNYGTVLQIYGLDLQPAVEIHFKHEKMSGGAVIRIGTTVDKITEVAFPEAFLELDGLITAYIYVSNTQSGQTEYKILTRITARPQPEAWDRPEDVEIWRQTVEAVNAAADRAETAATESKESALESAASAKKAEDTAKEIPGQVEEGKRNIDVYIEGKESELKGETGNVYFSSFRVVNGRLKMYSDPSVTKIVFRRAGSRLKYRVATGG